MKETHDTHLLGAGYGTRVCNGQGYCSYQREQANDSFTCSRNLVLRCLSLLPIELLEIGAVQEVMS